MMCVAEAPTAAGSRAAVTRHPGHDSAPSWSPDRRVEIVFTTKRDGNFEVYVMNADAERGRRGTRRPRNPAPDPAP